MNTHPDFIEELSLATISWSDKYAARLPDNYLDIQRSFIKYTLVIDSKTSLTVFHGGPLDFRQRGLTDAWLTPVCFMRRRDDGSLQLANYHLLSINCTCGCDFAEAFTTINLSTDDELKLASSKPDAIALHANIATADKTGRTRTVILRYAPIGSLAFPLMSFPNPAISTAFVIDGFRAIIDLFKLNVSQTDYTTRVDQLLQKIKLQLDNKLFPGVRYTSEQVLATAQGPIYITNVFSQNSVWGIYRLYSFKPLTTINRKQEVFIRIDSGCDVGMLYGDEGCDCLSQLLRALQPANGTDSIVVHIPLQDGRGYGCNSKSYTEGLKNGINAITRGEIQKMLTHEAAVFTFGHKFDIRSYREATEIIAALGFHQIGLVTDNAKKIATMKKALEKFPDARVRQIDTDTVFQMITDKESPLKIIQVALKTSEGNYQFQKTRESLTATLAYIGYHEMGAYVSNDTIRKILTEQYLTILDDCK